MSNTVSVPAFPNVPIYLGVPPVARAIGDIEVQVVTAIVDADSLERLAQPHILQWGVFDQSGSPVIVGDAVIAVDFRGDADVPDYPVENGGFASYNKFVRPKDIRVTIAADGTTVPPAQLIAQADAAVASTALYTVITPDQVYVSLNLVHYDYRRTAQNGAQMITIDVWATEIRVINTGQFSNKAQTPAAATPVSNGTVQPQTPTSGQVASMTQTSAGNGNLPSSVTSVLGGFSSGGSGGASSAAGAGSGNLPSSVTNVLGGFSSGGTAASGAAASGDTLQGVYYNGSWVGDTNAGSTYLEAGQTLGPAGSLH